MDESVPAHRNAPASSSRESVSEPRGKVVSGKHGIYTHFPKYRNCDICMRRAKITRALCRKRIGTVVPRAENCCDSITADHKILSEESESRNNRRYAVVVQDLATQWTQSYLCKTKTSQEPQKSLRQFLEPTWKPNVFFADNSLEFGKSFEDLSWNHCTSTRHRSETNGIAERAVRSVKGGTSAVLLQSGLDEKWWEDSMECCCYLRNIQDLWWENTLRTAIRRTIQRTNNSVWFDGRISPYFCQRPVASDCISSARKSNQGYSLAMRYTRRESGKETFWSQTLRNWKRWTHLKSMLHDSMQSKC